MEWTDKEIEAEVARQEQDAKEKDAIDAMASEYYTDQSEWAFAEDTPEGNRYAWVHHCGTEYYQLDCPDECYQGCEE